LYIAQPESYDTSKGRSIESKSLKIAHSGHFDIGTLPIASRRS
jgi:hypothetical protein